VDNAARAFGNLIVDVTGRKHGTPTIAQVGLIEASFKPALAVGHLAVYSRVHSKSLLASGFAKSRHLFKPRKHREISSFYEILPSTIGGFASLRN
jgi:hypothetical protein